MLVELGCRYVLLGHSERRAYCGETDEGVNRKVKCALEHGLTPIVAVGETLEQHKAGETKLRVTAQVGAAFEGITPAERARCVLAYEPIWAIGTGEVATPGDAQEVCAALRSELADLYSGDLADGVRVLYGGSVKPDNVAAIMAEEDVDGALVGGASLSVDDFTAIVRFRTQGGSAA